MSRKRKRWDRPAAAAAFAIAALLTGITLCEAASIGFEGELDPVPFDGATKAQVAGIGHITGTLDGSTLAIAATFSGLPSPASAAHLRMGLAMGVPGPVIGELRVVHQMEGTISGKVTLNAAQIAGLRANAVYIELDSEKAPGGNLWGWLEASG
jgi:hypothetical protein